MACIVHGSGGGNVLSSDLTAIAANVLAGTTYVGSDTNDKSKLGTMKNYSSSPMDGYPNYEAVVGQYTPETSGNSSPRITLRIPNAGYYNSSNYLYTLASNLGNAAKKEVLNGKQFTSIAGLKQSGTMPNNSTTSSNGNVPGINSSQSSYPTRESHQGTSTAYFLSAKEDTDGTFRLNMCPPEGYYPGKNSYVNVPMSELGNVPPANVLEKRGDTINTFTSYAGLRIKGKMKNYSEHNVANNNYMTSNRSSSIGGYVFARPVNAGFYDNTTEIRVPVENLSAANIKKGVVVGGIKGEFQGYVAEYGTIYNNGVWGNNFNNSYIIDWHQYSTSDPAIYTLTYDTTCIICTKGGSYQSHGVLIFTPSKLLNASGYSDITIQTSCQESYGYGDGTGYNYLRLSVKNANGTEIAYADPNYSAQNVKMTTTLSLANITQSVYFEVLACRDSGTYQPRNFTIYNVTLS